MLLPITTCLLLGTWSCTSHRVQDGVPTQSSSPGTDGEATPQAAIVTNLAPGPITLRCRATNLYVCAENAGAAALVANRAAALGWETFDLAKNADGSYTFKAQANGKFVCAENAGAGALIANRTAASTWESFSLDQNADGSYALLSRANGRYVSAAGGSLIANKTAVGASESFEITYVGDGEDDGGEITNPDFGPNVRVFSPSTSMATIQSQCATIFGQQQSAQFGSGRYALLFKPGTYSVDVNVGFYTHVAGLGLSPDEVTINGAVHAEADWFSGNATCNFWRAAENLSVAPTGGSNRWAVSQAAPFRRMHIRGSLQLDDGGWSSGGFLADSKIDGAVNSGSQQQWFSRNTQWGAWNGSNWNMTFLGVVNPPAGAWPSRAYTTIAQTPIVREKPFLYMDAAGAYRVFVPALRANTQGPSWTNGTAAGQSISLSQFHIAVAGRDTSATLNAALAAGKHLLITPGIYRLSDTLRVTKPNTVVLGLGLATLIPDNGLVAMTVADVEGVKLAGILFDAGPVNSPILLQMGPVGANADHAANPSSLHDVFCRVGGAAVGKASVSVQINSHQVIGDHAWIWRADHGSGVGWNTNTAANGLVVNGNNVTFYGLFVEHFQQHQTLWNGNGGRTYFYQNEFPYDPPSQAAWQHDGVNGWAAYKVAPGVTSHEAWGLGAYCTFNNAGSVSVTRAFEVPVTAGVKFHHMVTVSLGGRGTISHVINDTGGPSNSSSNVARVTDF